MRVTEKFGILKFLQKRNLVLRYKKNKELLKKGFLKNVDFKILEPKSRKIFSFRINRQFRAIGVLRDDNLIIYKIWDHQKDF